MVGGGVWKVRMNRTTTLLMVVMLVIGGVSAFPMAAAAQSNSSDSSAIGQSTFAQVDENASENATNVTPGERLSGVIGVSQAEFEGEMELRAYGIEFAKSATADAKADVVADRLERIQTRLDELEERKQALDEARENGSIDEGEYNAQVAELAARTETVKQMASASEDRANSLPTDVLESKGINVTAIQTLKTNAENLTGAEVAGIAQSIAGDQVGKSVSQGAPSDIGVPDPDDRGDGAGNGSADEVEAAIDRAASQLDAAETRLAQAEELVGENASDNATAAIEQAREELQQARQALEDARNALEDGNQTQALEHAEDALGHAEQAEAHAQEALDEVQQSGQDGSEAGEGTPTETGGNGS